MTDEDRVTPAERAGDVQRLLAEEARRLDPSSRGHLANALWLAVAGAEEQVAAAVTQAIVVASDDEASAAVQQAMLTAISAAVARLEVTVAVAANVSPLRSHSP